MKFLIFWICSVFMFSTASFCQQISWTGTWETSFNKLQLTQNGNQVTGYYEHDNGKILGTVKGNQLIGTWSESGNDTGRFQFTMSADGKSFSGNWGGSTGALGSSWNGSRLSPQGEQTPMPPHPPRVFGRGPGKPPLIEWN